MSKQKLICLVAALLLTMVTIAIALFTALALTASTTVNTSGISAVAGGVSSNVFILLLAASPVLFVILFLTFRRVFQKRG